ncbi:MAG: SusD/RagB family nutrient-binding outer membrane lipoprotein [Pseudopedobacter saltans]|uniref:SusD/RagB family nutrient-binding outer membrane lipoprotein n=1 Tax=Pseudopedobacter saltans TaxID=151895 RepID=A0A2W5F7R6_9SPHI|nr:MAG: SusD/RagB family nutrient-binding outer membrane lipoprotein [Pseudopedobacter saltans]
MKKIVLYTLLILVSSSCTKNFDEINTNPNASLISRADYLTTSMLVSITTGEISTAKTFMQPFMLGKYILWTEQQDGNQYNSLGQASFSRLTVLRNVDPMLQYASSNASTYPSYIGMAHFIRAWQFFQSTIEVGDIPYSQAILGESENNIKPVYDTQKEVFMGILKELDQADSAFAVGAKFDGDFVYSGDVDKWRRLVNGFQLHVLMNLYKKTDDADLSVINRFKNIVNTRPLMRTYADNFAITYQNSAGYCYPWSSTSLQKNQYTIYPMVSSTLIDSLKAHNDRRLFYYAEPAASIIKAGGDSSSFSSYIGIEPSDQFSSTTTAHSNGAFSDVNRRYVQLFNAEPVSLFSYWQQQFILAEAAARGWINGSAETYYESGISGSMNFLANFAGATTTSTYVHKMPLTADYISSYLKTVQLTGSMDNQIMQILTQKYMAGFLQGANNDAWFDFRRTGYPVFKLNPNTNQNTPSSQFPVRWRYPQAELDNNADNYKASIQSQYAGVDDANQIMWILK